MSSISSTSQQFAGLHDETDDIVMSIDEAAVVSTATVTAAVSMLMKTQTKTQTKTQALTQVQIKANEDHAMMQAKVSTYIYI